MASSFFDITFEVTEIPPVFSESEQKIAALHKEATSYKKMDLEKAISLLQEASDLMRKDDAGYLIEQWMRLPLYLQEAGRFDEAMREFERLLEEVRPRAEKELGQYFGQTYIECRVHLHNFKIYDKMRLVCKREKLVDKAKEYQRLFEKHELMHSELSAIIDQERIK